MSPTRSPARRHARSTPPATAALALLAVAALGTSWLLEATGQDRRRTLLPQATPRVTKPRSIPRTDPATSRATAVTATGFRVKLLRQVLLGFDRVGTISKLGLQEGTRVQANQVIAQLDDRVAVAALASAAKKASNDVHKRYAMASYAVARTEHEQAVQTNKANNMVVVPLIEVKKLLLAAQRSQLQIEQAEHDQAVAVLDRDLAQTQLTTYSLVAPFDGVVTRRFKQQGEAIRQGDPVIELVDTSTMKVEGRIPLADAIKLRPGQPVTVRLVDSEDRTGALPSAFKEARFPGRLVYIDPGVSLVGERDVRVWAEVANRGGLLRHGLTAEISIETKSP